MNTNSISRRRFAQLLGIGAASAMARPALTMARQAQQPAPPAVRTRLVRLSANENPFGPSPKALQAMSDTFGLACRYPDEHAEALVAGLAKLNGVDPGQILLGAGSGEILKLCA